MLTMPNMTPRSFAMSRIDDDCLPIKKMRRVRDDDEPPPKRKRRFPVWGWLLIGVGGIVLTCGGGALAVATTMNRSENEGVERDGVVENNPGHEHRASKSLARNPR